MVLSLLEDNDEYNTGTHLDSHANMAVCGKHCRVVADTGFKADITTFSDEVGQMLEVLIVDALILYENLSSGEKFPLVVKNTLHVPSMNHNLIPPFSMRQASIIVNDKAKIFCDNPTRDDHAIIDKEMGMHIILSIKNTFLMMTFTIQIYLLLLLLRKENGIQVHIIINK